MPLLLVLLLLFPLLPVVRGIRVFLAHGGYFGGILRGGGGRCGIFDGDLGSLGAVDVVGGVHLVLGLAPVGGWFGHFGGKGESFKWGSGEREARKGELKM